MYISSDKAKQLLRNYRFFLANETEDYVVQELNISLQTNEFQVKVGEEVSNSVANQLLYAHTYYNEHKTTTSVAQIFLVHGYISFVNELAVSLIAIDEKDLLGVKFSNLMPRYQSSGILSEVLIDDLYDKTSALPNTTVLELLVNGSITLLDAYTSLQRLENSMEVMEIVLINNSETSKEYERLRLSEIKYKTIAENTPGLTKISNVNNLYYYFNKNWRTYLNISDGKKLVESWLDYIHPDDLPKLLRNVDYAYKRKIPYRIEYRIKDFNDVYNYFEDYGEPIMDDNKVFIGYVSTAVDTTDAKKLIQISHRLDIQLIVDQEVKRNIQDTNRFIIGIDSSDVVVYANLFALNTLVGLDLTNPKTFFEYFDLFVDKFNITSVYEFFSKKLGEKIEVSFSTEMNPKGVNRLHYIFTAIFISSSDLLEGKVIYLIAEDISQVETQRRTLEIKESKLQDVLNSMQDLYFKIDRNFTLVDVNSNSKSLLGYEPEEILNTSVEDKVIQISNTILRHIIKNRSLSTVTIKLIDNKGERLFFNCKIKLVLDDGKLYFVGVARDISDILKGQFKLVQKNKRIIKLAETKDQFLANMSHEIRTPLNGIIGLVDLLSKEGLSFPADTYVATIKQSSTTLLRIINDILDLSKLDADLYTLRYAHFNILDFLGGLISLYEPLAIEKGIKFSYSCDGDVPTELYGDRTRLSQILGNVISNSIKFTYSGSVEVIVSVLETLNELVHVEFKVIDTGIGIDLESQSKLFKAFSQLDSSQSKAEQGTGLGLYISHKLVKLMNGNILFTSKKGEGTIFYISIPFEMRQKVTPTESIHVELNSFQLSLYGRRILIVDDNQTNLTVASQLLKHFGAEVSLATSGTRGVLALLNDVNYDVIFMDIQMPMVSGVDTLFILREIIGFNIPLVALTAYSMVGDMEKYLRMGFTAYLPKPINLDSILDLFTHSLHLEAKSQSAQYLEVDTSFYINAKQHGDLLSILGKELYWESVSEFQIEFSAILNDIPSATDAELTKLLHTVKGTAATLGFKMLSKLAEFYESLSMKTIVTSRHDLVELLQIVCTQSIKFVH